MKDIFKNASMNIREFLSNDNDFNELIPENDRAELFLQNLWKRKVSWDQSLENDDLETWEILISHWPTKVKEISRKVIDPDRLEQLEIHVFTDASTTTYAAVYAKQGINTFLVFAKSRIAPVKGITIPKLELLAILIGVRATKFAIKQLEIEE
ncbi:unnamed protein product, partial [Acanthocheilonema viteae]